MKHSVLTLVALLALASPTLAEDFRFSVPDSEPLQTEAQTEHYACGDVALDVLYINSGSVSLAAFTYDGEPVVASNVISASGARYAGGRYVWWTKGNDASLYDEMSEDDAPILECSTAG